VTPTIRPFDPLLALETLTRHGVRFVIIGGFGGRLRGSPTVTGDLDVCYARERENLEHMAAALLELHAALRGAPVDLPFRPDAGTLAAGDHFTFATEAGSLDCLGTPAGTTGYDDLAADADELDLGGLRAWVASVDDLIRMKLAAGRPKDRIEAEVLGALRQEIEDPDR
jgi:hypothetical protein